ncbi:MAG TPA: PASTA domain-containing protein [Candidatus Angelobacter sp.]
MLRKLLRYFLLALVLLLVFLASALLSMRLAIHGREVRVPALAGLTSAQAERIANASGLVLSVENHFYTPQVPRGRIVSQVPAPDTRVRRGWKVQVAESLGPQRAAVPNLIGQSEHAADVNLGRHGLEVGSVATLRLPGAPPDTVVAQNPLPNTNDATSPRINLIFSAANNARNYVMPSFVGKTLSETTDALEGAGFTVGKVWSVAAPATEGSSFGAPEIIVRQYPPAGQRVIAGTPINFEVSK